MMVTSKRQVLVQSVRCLSVFVLYNEKSSTHPLLKLVELYLNLRGLYCGMSFGIFVVWFTKLLFETLTGCVLVSNNC